MSCFSGECGHCSYCIPESPFSKMIKHKYRSPTEDYKEVDGYEEYMKKYEEYLKKEKIRNTKLEDLIKNS